MNPPRRLFLAVAAMLVATAIVVIERLDAPDRGPAVSPSAAPAAAGVRGLYVLPDDTAAPLLAEIEEAASSIDVAVYLLSDQEIVGALTDAEDRGVAVRVILDPAPYGGGGDPAALVPELAAGGVEVRWGVAHTRFTHVKTIIVDDAVAMILNVNLTESSFEGNREFGVITTRAEEARAAAELFEADWDGVRPDDGPLIVSPYDSRTELTAMIVTAAKTLDIYAEVIRDVAVVEALRTAAERGVVVRIVLPPDPDPAFVSLLAALLESGVQVRFLTSPYAHAKAILADDARLFVGSQNFTATSLDENRELGIIVDDAPLIARFSSIFDRDWAAAEPALATPVAGMR